MPESTIASRRIYDGRILNLRVDTVELPDGKTSTREIVEHRGAVALVVLDAERNVLLVRQYRKPLERYMLEIPAGTLERGEEPDKCAEREMQEETGFAARSFERIGGFFSAPGFCTEYLYLYLATDLTPSSLDGDEDESIELVRMPFDQALALIDNGEICDSKSVAGLLLAARRVGSSV
ncbi:MAG: NUDIX hydrolase [Chloroflexota bacterium]|nr:MAG: NUDIX hydrolase [Chloroflexota bacterium]